MRSVRVAAKTRRPRNNANVSQGEEEAARPQDPSVKSGLAGVDFEVPEEERDFWEGEQFDVLGKVASAGLFIVAGLTVLIGAYASATYNEGAAPVDFDSVKAEIAIRSGAGGP